MDETLDTRRGTPLAVFVNEKGVVRCWEGLLSPGCPVAALKEELRPRDDMEGGRANSEPFWDSLRLVRPPDLGLRVMLKGSA